MPAEPEPDAARGLHVFKSKPASKQEEGNVNGAVVFAYQCQRGREECVRGRIIMEREDRAYVNGRHGVAR